MTHSNDSQRPRHTSRQFTAAALVLLAGVGWARHVSAAYPDSCGSATGAAISAGPTDGKVFALVVDSAEPSTLYAGAGAPACSRARTAEALGARSTPV